MFKQQGNIPSRYIDEMLQEFKDPMTIQILAMGEGAVGKSTLLNGLIGTNFFKTGDSVNRVTTKLEKRSVTKYGIVINVFDSRGLSDADLDDDDQTLQNAQQECGQIDLFLFCMKMPGRISRTNIQEMKAITRIYGRDIWKKAMFVLTFANTYKPDQTEQFVDKFEEWTQDLKERISKIIGPELGSKVPVVPAGHTAPELPDRESWISELWIQGFRRMGFRAMVKLYIISQERLHSTTEKMKLSQEMYTMPEEQPLIACYMTPEIVNMESVMSENKVRIAGLIVGVIVSGTIAIALPVSVPLLPTVLSGAFVGEWTTVELFHYFGWNNVLNYFNLNEKKEEIIVNCHEEAILRSLILAFIEEYPEYVNDDTYKKLKDELDFNNKDKTNTKKEF